MKWRLIALFLFLPGMLVAQNSPADTAGIYKSIYKYSKDRKLVYFFYRAVFNVPPDPLGEIHDKSEEQNALYHELSGKVIRSISVVTLEPFGTSFSDSAIKARSFLQKAGNSLHFKTKERIVRNYLLFREGEALDPLKFAETERLLRASGFIRDLSVEIISPDSQSDSVDVLVTTRDLWSVSNTAIFTSEKISGRLTSYNILGSGQRFSNRIDYRYNESPPARPDFQGYYLVPSIGNTYISSEVSYAFLENETKWGVNVDRPFYSALTRQAGGISYYNRDLSDSIYFSDNRYEPYRFVSGEWSAWAGRSFLLRNGRTMEEQSSRLVITTAYTRTRYNRLEVESGQAAERFQPGDLYLGGIGYSNRKYYVDRYIFRFGEVEDVPSGRLISFVGGYEQRADSGRYFMQYGLSASGYLKSTGYVSVKAGYETFFREKEFSDGLFSAGVFAFSGLLPAGRWKARIFGNAALLMGFNRKPGDILALNTENGIAGYRAGTPLGTSRLSLNVAAVLFNPFEWIGFRISPVVFAGAAMTGDQQNSLMQGKLYKSIGAGIAVTNIFLANSTFKIFFGYYPDIKDDQFRISSFEVWDYRFVDYDFGKPEVQEFK